MFKLYDRTDQIGIMITNVTEVLLTMSRNLFRIQILGYDMFIRFPRPYHHISFRAHLSYITNFINYIVYFLIYSNDCYVYYI